jgi:hypothetical protein
MITIMQNINVKMMFLENGEKYERKLFTSSAPNDLPNKLL